MVNAGNTQKSKGKKHYDWMVMPDAYFAAALLIAQNIPAGMNDEAAIGGTFKKLGFRSAHANWELFRPAVFNFKQGIELYLKCLGLIDHGRYLASHDLKRIFDFIKKEASKKNKKFVKKLHTDTWPIIKKYYYGTYAGTGNQDERHPDKMNEVERFPERMAKTLKKRSHGVYKLEQLHKFTNGDALGIIKDVKTLEKIFSQAKRDIKPARKFGF